MTLEENQAESKSRLETFLSKLKHFLEEDKILCKLEKPLDIQSFFDSSQTSITYYISKSRFIRFHFSAPSQVLDKSNEIELYYVHNMYSLNNNTLVKGYTNRLKTKFIDITFVVNLLKTVLKNVVDHLKSFMKYDIPNMKLIKKTFSNLNILDIQLTDVLNFEETNYIVHRGVKYKAIIDFIGDPSLSEHIEARVNNRTNVTECELHLCYRHDNLPEVIKNHIMLLKTSRKLEEL